ncbi:MAG: FAD-binding oxidoreductase, partial [Hyphomicrobiales bacterium]|nr:FAD-binding oxidoreductase [Hyphomicrobiales bacterium]
MRTPDIIIIGGGIVGSAVAYYLARTGRAGCIAVIEPDPTYEFSATPAANGGIRQLFSLPENIAMAQYGLEVYAGFAEAMAINGAPADIGFRRRGYLFVSDDGGHAQMAANYNV